MLLKEKQVAIIGAGPVGLTMARLLQQKGVNVKVYERDKASDARIWGGTLDLHKHSGQAAMQSAGLLQQYYDLAIPMGVKFTDEKSRVISVRDLRPEEEHDNPEINRNALRKMLLGSLTAGTVIWDSKCNGLDVQDRHWLLQFENGTSAEADLVIGANGGMSRLRSYVTDSKALETGSFIIQGDVPDPEQHLPELYRLCDGHRLMAAYGGNLTVINPCNGGQLSYGVIFQKPEEWQNEVALDFNDNIAVCKYLSQRFTGWDKQFHTLFGVTSFFAGIPTRVLPLVTPWKSARPLPITIIGDAAHLMPPFAGQGVNTGLMDASILADNLTGGKFATITAAIADYEQQMLVYASQAQRDSRENELEMRDLNFSFQQLMKP